MFAFWKKRKIGGQWKQWHEWKEWNNHFKFIMGVRNSTKLWEVSNNMESTKICHEGSSLCTQWIYGILAYSMWFPSQTKHIHLEWGLKSRFPKRMSSNLWFSEHQWTIHLTSCASLSSFSPFQLRRKI
jgi:hypothetical protein